MKNRFHPTPPYRTGPIDRRSTGGVAIVIVLAVIVLLAGLVMAFFSRISVETTATNSDASAAKAELLARSALGTIVSDLKQEIVVSSSSVTVGSGTNIVTLYLPKTQANMLPARSGTSGTSPDPVPNLIRRSVRSDGITVSSSASAVNSATDVSFNGRSVSTAHWNAHYLIPRKNSTSTEIDSTPVDEFTAPDWIFVNRAGRVVINSVSSTLANASATNQNFVIGRYAYAIYDEGGLLDINIAGYPSAASTTTVGRKGQTAFADLTQLPTESGTLSASIVDKLIGWRNYASAQPSGSYPSFSFDSTSADRYTSYITSNTTGFLNLSGSTYNNRTDQAVLTRQQLLQLGRSLGMSQNVYQYLGTFSRDLEQPSFIPNPNRPRVQSSGSVNNSTFGTGNDAYGLDRNSDPSTDINPPFLQVRVKTSFTRPDGTTANIGDPLVAKRFPLSRLGLLTSSATATKSQNDPIYRSFGLYRSTASAPWTYDHGNSTGIMRLSDVAGASSAREPDFFELLKAAIGVGSLSKGALHDIDGNGTTIGNPQNAGTEGYYEQIDDTSTTRQIFQIGANIINQYKSDNFPVQIQIATSNTTTTISGVNDLPYLYALRTWTMQYQGSPGALGAVYIQPELWNPHSPSSSSTLSATDTPTHFRIRAKKQDGATDDPFLFSVYYKNSGSVATGGTIAYPDLITFNNALYSENSCPPPVYFTAGALNNYCDFREPTLLGAVGRPANANITSTGGHADLNTTGSPIITGILLADSVPWENTVTGTDSKSYTLGVDKVGIGINASNSCIHFYLDYLDSNNNWVTYDDQVYQYFWQPPGQTHDFKYNDYEYRLTNTATFGAMRTDPRTSRWGIPFSERYNSRALLDSSLNKWGTAWSGDTGFTACSFASHYGSFGDNGFVNWRTSNSSPSNIPRYGFPYGQWTINNVQPTNTSPSVARYNRDPDGVARRAMGGYVTDSNNGPYSGASFSISGTTAGLPMVTGNYASRPLILHRPFRSVADLGYAFRGSIWKNIDFSFPESGDSALLDVFCINENTNSSALTSGRVNLNTRQAPVLQTLIASTLKDLQDLPTTTDPAQITLTGTIAAELAQQLVNHTTGTTQLINRADLVGRWNAASSSGLASNADPSLYYTGFSSAIGTCSSTKGTDISLNTRQRESVIRALADTGCTRTWNLLIDVIAQSGRYPKNSNSLANFVVEGEKRYWLHIAIDRFTGTVLDSQLEVVK